MAFSPQPRRSRVDDAFWPAFTKRVDFERSRVTIKMLPPKCWACATATATVGSLSSATISGQLIHQPVCLYPSSTHRVNYSAWLRDPKTSSEIHMKTFQIKRALDSHISITSLLWNFSSKTLIKKDMYILLEQNVGIFEWWHSLNWGCKFMNHGITRKQCCSPIFKCFMSLWGINAHV